MPSRLTREQKVSMAKEVEDFSDNEETYIVIERAPDDSFDACMEDCEKALLTNKEDAANGENDKGKDNIEKEKENDNSEKEKIREEASSEPMEAEQACSAEQINTTAQPKKLFPVPEDNTFKIVFAGNLKLDKSVWNVKQTKIVWQTGTHLTLDEQTEEILTAIRDPQPKHIAVLCYQNFLVDYRKQEIYQSIQTITEAAVKAPHIKLVFGTIPFIPELEYIWRETGDVNDFIRVRNIRDIDTAPLSVHKSLMVSKQGCSIQQVKGKYWQEFEDQSGVGSSLSFEGMLKIAKWVIRHFDTAFTDEDRPKGVNHLKELIPKPLKYTACYKNNPKMMEILKEREEKRNQVRSRSKYSAAKEVEQRRHSTGANETKDDKRRLPRHVSYNGAGNEPNLKIKIEANKFDKKWEENNKDERKRPRQADDVFEVQWEETRKVVEVASDQEEEQQEKVTILMADLKDLHDDYNTMQKDKETYKARIEALESLNEKQAGRLQLLEAEEEGNMKEIKWLQKKLMKAEEDLEAMTQKYDTQMAIRDEVNKFFNFMRKETKKLDDEEKKEKKKNKKD